MADLLDGAGAAASPATFIGRLAMAPLPGFGAPALGALLLALPLAGLAVVGGTSLEAARRRAGLVAQLRFAVTMQDVRTVILLRRQLASEGPRGRPWLRLAPGGWLARRGPVVQRDCHGVLRWPAARLVRVGGLGVVAGAAAAAAWRGTPALVAVSGLALLVAAFDAVEGLAQEADHPTRSEGLPVGRGWLRTRHLAVPSALMVTVAGVAVAVAVAVGAGPPLAVLAVGAVVAGPAALAAVCGAALSMGGGPVDPLEVGPLGNAKAVAVTFGPAVVAVIGVLPLLGARAAVDAGGSVLAGALTGAVPALLAVAAVRAWLGRGG